MLPRIVPISHRSGVTLIELLLFIGVLGLVIWLTLPLLASTGQNQVRQESMSLVERNAAQIFQTLGQHIRGAERILYPTTSATGMVLALRSETTSQNPTVIGLSGSTLMLFAGQTSQVISSPEVRVEQFTVRKTSASTSRESVRVKFTLRQNLRLLQSGSTLRSYDTTFTLFPDDSLSTHPCSCSAPTCVASQNYQWQTCNSVTPSTCDTITAMFNC